MGRSIQAEEDFDKWLCQFVNRPLSRSRGPERVYHYTSAAGLLAILGSRCLLASHAATMNDPGEIRYASGILSQAFEAEGVRYSSEHIPKLLNFVSGALDRIGGEARVYLTCFSEQPDLLALWRAYADNGRGFALGFALEDVGADSWIQVGGPAFRRAVVYDAQEQQRLAADVAAAACRYSDEAGYQADARTVAQIQEVIVECSVCFKHPAYAEEKEWRAIYIENPVTHLTKGVRVRNGSPVPYVELPIPNTVPSSDGQIALREIVIGPSNDLPATERLVRDSLTDICGADFASSVAIVGSSVPYRA